MSLGTGIKSAFRTVKNTGRSMVRSGFLKDTVAPGVKSAFSQSGGAAGLGRRILGGAAIGGAGGGVVESLRGGDFWEGAVGGAKWGGMAGGARQIQQMGRSSAGQQTLNSIRNEYSRLNPKQVKSLPGGPTALLDNTYSSSRTAGPNTGTINGRPYYNQGNTRRREVGPDATKRDIPRNQTAGPNVGMMSGRPYYNQSETPEGASRQFRPENKTNTRRDIPRSRPAGVRNKTQKGNSISGRHTGYEQMNLFNPNSSEFTQKGKPSGVSKQVAALTKNDQQARKAREFFGMR